MVKRILGIILLTAFVILPSTTAFAEGNSPGNLYYIGRVGEEEHIVIPYTTTNGEHGFLGIDSVNNVYSDERQPDTRADGDPVLPYTTYNA